VPPVVCGELQLRIELSLDGIVIKVGRVDAVMHHATLPVSVTVKLPLMVPLEFGTPGRVGVVVVTASDWFCAASVTVNV
jgi:hypothetical protein